MTVKLAVGILEVTLGSCICLCTQMHCIEFAHGPSRSVRTQRTGKVLPTWIYLKSVSPGVSALRALAWAGCPCPVQASCTQIWLVILISSWHQQTWASAILVELHMLQSHLTAVQTFCRHRRAFEHQACVLLPPHVSSICCFPVPCYTLMLMANESFHYGEQAMYETRKTTRWYVGMILLFESSS